MKLTNERISSLMIAISVIILAVFIMGIIYLSCSYSSEVQGYGPEPELVIETSVIKTICGPCLAYTDLEYIECGKQIGRFEIAYADGVCRRKDYDYGGMSSE